MFVNACTRRGDNADINGMHYPKILSEHRGPDLIAASLLLHAAAHKANGGATAANTGGVPVRHGGDYAEPLVLPGLGPAMLDS